MLGLEPLKTGASLSGREVSAKADAADEIPKP
jgi:hypothetical protein